MREDPWLAERMGRPCFTIEPGDSPRDAATRGFYQAKIPCPDVARASELEAAGFRVVDVNVTLERDPGALEAPADVEVGEAGEADREELLAIAANDYDVSRFHMDPEVPAEVASAIKRDWVAAYFDGERGERLLVARADGRAIGFLAVLGRHEAKVIDLVAVRSVARGGGAGHALVARLVREADRRVRVGTQAANVRALRFYERLGFEASDTRFVLHRHVA